MNNLNESKTICRMTAVICDSILINRLPYEKKLDQVHNKQRSKKFHDETDMLLKNNLASFISNICSACYVEESSLILSLVYLDRVILNTKVILTQDNLKEILIGCVIAAVKFNQDYHCIRNIDAVTGLHPFHISYIESYTLEALGYSLFVSEITFETYSFHLASFKATI